MRKTAAVALTLAVVLVLVSLTLRRGAPEPDDFYAAPASVPTEGGGGSNRWWELCTTSLG